MTDETPTRRSRSQGRRSTPVVRAGSVWRVVGRASSAVLVLACAATVVVLGDEVPTRAPVVVPPAAVDVAPGEAAWVCPGPVRVPTEPEGGTDAAYDPQFDPAPVASAHGLVALVDAGTPSTLTDLAGTDERPAPAGAPVGVSEVAGEDGTSTLRAGPAEEGAVGGAAAVSTRTSRGDLRGLVAASCQVPAPEIWLVGGSTTLGSSARLVLQNPGRTAATVEVHLWGPSGVVEPVGAPQYLVPPGEERVVLLEGVAAEQPRLVVQLVTAGGLVTAHLQDSALRGLVPAGVDHVVAARPPATEQAVPAISVGPTPAGGADGAVLRLLAPGDAATVARIRLLGPDGVVDLPGAAEVPLRAGEVLDVPLSGLPGGVYTAHVEADEPVVAGAMITRGDGVGAPRERADLPLERAWVPAVAPGTAGLLALPPGGDARLSLATVASAGEADVVLEVVGSDGAVLDVRELALRAGTTTAIDLPSTAAGRPVGVRLTGEVDDVVWGAALLDPTPSGVLLAAVVPVGSDAAPGEVAVAVD